MMVRMGAMMGRLTGLKRRFGFDERENPREQHALAIAMRNTEQFLVSRLLPAMRYLLVIIVITCILSLIFAVVMWFHLDQIGITGSLDFKAVFFDSIAAFENISFVTGEGDPSFIGSLSGSMVERAKLVVDDILFAERIVGGVVNSILLASLVAVALRPINPIWLSPRLVLDTSSLGLERLIFRYWIRYSERKWMHNVTCLVRFQSDAADRSIDQAMEIDSEHEEHHTARRGVCEVNLGFDDVRQDINGEAVGSARKRALALMLLAEHGEAGCTYRVRFGSYEEIIHLTKDLIKKYADYHILFRVTGTTVNGRNVLVEKKYSIGDVLFGYIYKVPEEVEGARGLTRDGGATLKRYKYNYDNAWRVETCLRGFRPIDYDIMGVVTEIGAKRCIECIGKGENRFLDASRKVSRTATIRREYADYLREEDCYFKDVARDIFGIMSKVHEALDNKDTYVISTEDKIVEKLSIDAFAYLAYVGGEDGSDVERKGKPVGFAIFQRPRNPVDNFAYSLGMSENEADKVLMIDSVAVLPEFRGQNLQRRLLALGEEEGIREGCRIFIATVDPRNKFSLNNFIAAGYHRIKIVRVYGGKPREILVKRFRDSFETE